MTAFPEQGRTAKLPAGVLLLAALLLAACTGDGSTPGGATSLPGPLPEGVAFHEAPEGAPPAPVFTVDLVDGTPLTVSDLWTSRPAVLLFTASWCAHCAELHAEIAALVEGYDDAVALLAVAGEDDLESLTRYVQDLGLDHPVALESDSAWLKYAVREPPLVALVAPGGRILRGWPGGVEADVLAEEIDALIDRSNG
jgi:thiol-disulfide isomerase/thioredoxin